MKEFRYILQPRGKKEVCPYCNHRGTWRRYIDTLTGEILPATFGRCDRENSCAAFVQPYSDKDFLKEWESGRRESVPLAYVPALPPVRKEPCFFPSDIVKRTTDRHTSHLERWLSIVFDSLCVREAFERYGVGTANNGACIFWQRDEAGNFRGGKIMQYDHGRRDHETPITWAHTSAKRAGLLPSDWTLKQCFFGLHLLDTFKGDTVGIVESEKTAIICSMYDPCVLWLAAGGCGQLTAEKLRPLHERGLNVILYPDSDPAGLDRWAKNRENLNVQIYNGLWEASDIVHREKGFDLGDYFVLKHGRERLEVLRDLGKIHPEPRTAAFVLERELSFYGSKFEEQRHIFEEK